MKTLFLALAIFSALSMYGADAGSSQQLLAPPPSTTEILGDMRIRFDDRLPSPYNNLSVPEKQAVGLLYQVLMPGHRIFADQMHRHTLAVISLFRELHDKSNVLKAKLSGLDGEKFVRQIRHYFMFLLANHGQYFARAIADQKRTPKRLGLDLLTQENLRRALDLVAPQYCVLLDQLASVIFDQTYEPTLTVYGHPGRSAVHIPSRDRKMLYSITGRYAQDLVAMRERLKKVIAHAEHYPAYFDTHFVSAFKALRKFFKTGEKSHEDAYWLEWVKSKTRVGCTNIFGEDYLDPLEKNMFFEGDITIARESIEKVLLPLLSSFEQRMPIADDYKRAPDQPLPNVVVVEKIAACGLLGPADAIAAYCFPNDQALRAKGSKQIIYSARKPTASLATIRNLFFLPEQADWLAKNDPEHSLLERLLELIVFLHETLGHGSGKLGKHTFVAGDPLTIEINKEEITYAVGDEIPVTAEIQSQLMPGTANAMEELRAEVNALYVAVAFIDDLWNAGLFDQWEGTVTCHDLQDWFLIYMIHDYARYMVTQPDDAQEMLGTHSVANSAIIHFLEKAGAIELTRVSATHENQPQQVFGGRVLSREKAIAALKELVKQVQVIVSRADGIGANALLNAYGKPIDKDLKALLKKNDLLVNGGVKMDVILTPMFDTNGTPRWPRDLIDFARGWDLGPLE